MASRSDRRDAWPAVWAKRQRRDVTWLVTSGEISSNPGDNTGAAAAERGCSGKRRRDATQRQHGAEIWASTGVDIKSAPKRNLQNRGRRQRSPVNMSTPRHQPNARAVEAVDARARIAQRRVERAREQPGPIRQNRRSGEALTATSDGGSVKKANSTR